MTATGSQPFSIACRAGMGRRQMGKALWQPQGRQCRPVGWAACTPYTACTAERAAAQRTLYTTPCEPAPSLVGLPSLSMMNLSCTWWVAGGGGLGGGKVGRREGWAARGLGGGRWSLQATRQRPAAGRQARPNRVHRGSGELQEMQPGNGAEVVGRQSMTQAVSPLAPSPCRPPQHTHLPHTDTTAPCCTDTESFPKNPTLVDVSDPPATHPPSTLCPAPAPAHRPRSGATGPTGCPSSWKWESPCPCRSACPCRSRWPCQQSPWRSGCRGAQSPVAGQQGELAAGGMRGQVKCTRSGGHNRRQAGAAGFAMRICHTNMR